MNRKAWSDDEEDFSSDSLDELVDLMIDPKPGDTVYVGDVVDVPRSYLIDSEDVIDIIADRAHDIGGEHAWDYPDVTEEAKGELDTLLSDWIKEHCPPTFYRVTNVKPYVLAAEDLL